VHPFWPIEERQRRLPNTPNTDAPHQPGGIDKAHFIYETPWGRKANRDRTQEPNNGERFRYTAQAEGVRMGEHDRRQGLQDRAHSQAREYRIIDHC